MSNEDIRGGSDGGAEIVRLEDRRPWVRWSVHIAQSQTPNGGWRFSIPSIDDTELNRLRMSMVLLDVATDLQEPSRAMDKGERINAERILYIISVADATSSDWCAYMEEDQLIDLHLDSGYFQDDAKHAKQWAEENGLYFRKSVMTAPLHFRDARHDPE